MLSSVIKWIAFSSLVCLSRCESPVGKLPHCVNEEQVGSILVSTLDGKVTSLKPDGEIAWEMETGHGPLLTSNIHNVELTNNGEWVRIIPSLNGNLYKFNGETIDAIPINADSLLMSSHVYSSDLVIAGGRNVHTYGIVMKTGQTLYECSSNGCQNKTSWDNSFDDIVIVERSSITVRAHEPRTGVEKWNFSVGYHNLKMPVSDCVTLDSTVTNLNVTAVLPKGIICASKPKSVELLWQHKFEYPIAKIWKWDGRNLIPVDTFERPVESQSLSKVSPAIYLGMHNKQLYIQESDRMWSNLQVDNVPEKVNVIDSQSLTRFPWKPISAYQKQEEADQSTALSVLYSSDYINGNGYYFFTEHDVKLKNTILCSDNSTTSLVKNIADGGFYSVNFLIILFLTILFYKEVFVHMRRNDIVSARSTSNRTETLSNRSSSVSVNVSDISEAEYKSRFDEFTINSVLGKGGFGTVFEAYHNFDKGTYAIKMIKLLRESDFDYFLREIKTLASLKHPNIVSYNTSWKETPPVGWTYKCLQNSNLSVEDSLTMTSVTAEKQLPKIITSDEMDEDDSFIVFEETTTNNKKVSILTSQCSQSEEIFSRTDRDASNFGVEGTDRQISYLFIQMQLCEKHTLKQWLEKKDPERKDLAKIYKIYQQILNAVEYIHSKQLIHRDLKPSNIFFSGDNDVKVADFGLATSMSSPCESSGEMDNRSHTQNVGTYLYMSPEQQEKRNYNHKVDIFSLGVILFELLNPFGSDMERVKVLSSLRNGNYPENFSASFPREHPLLESMLSHEPRVRPEAKTVKDKLQAIVRDVAQNLV